jgi:uncharacterized protein with GYD domain
MPLYMFQGTYTPKSWATMTKNPQDRSVGLYEMIQKLGGKLINLYYCFGEYDVVAICKLTSLLKKCNRKTARLL